MHIPLINFNQNLSFTKNLAIHSSLTLRPLPHTTSHLALALTKIYQFYPIVPCHAPCLTPQHALLLTFARLAPSKKRPFSKKHTDLKSKFCKQNVHSLKNTVLLCHFFKFFMMDPQLLRQYLVKKRSILSELYYNIGPKSQQNALFFRFFMKK